MSIATPPSASQPVPAVDQSDGLYEVIDGRIVEKPPMSAYVSWLANLLARLVGNHAEAHQLGRAVTEMLFDLQPERPQRRPDFAFVSYERWPRNRRIPGTNAWSVVPDLAVEVISPSNLAEDAFNKVVEYFEAGVRLVWVIYPNQQVVQVYEAPTKVRGLGVGEILDGGVVLPGFQLPLSTLFEEDTVAE